MLQTKVAEKIKTYFSRPTIPPLTQNHAIYEIMWNNVVEQGRTQKIWRMRIACWIH